MTGPYWASLISEELDDPHAAQVLIAGIEKILPEWRELGVDIHAVGKTAGSTRGAVRQELEKLQKNISGVRDSLASVSTHAKGKINYIEFSTLAHRLLSGEIVPEARPGRRAIVDLEDLATEVSSYVAQALEELPSKRGNPPNQPRDLLILCIANEFHKSAASIPLSNSRLSLFYRVTEQYLADNDVYDDHLSRTIERLFPDQRPTW